MNNENEIPAASDPVDGKALPDGGPAGNEPQGLDNGIDIEVVGPAHIDPMAGTNRRWVKPLASAAGMVAAATVALLVVAGRPNLDLAATSPSDVTVSSSIASLGTSGITVNRTTSAARLPGPGAGTGSYHRPIPQDSGTGLRLVGTASWTNAVLGDDPTRLTITAPQGSCSTRFLPMVTAESPTRVIVQVAVYQDDRAIGELCVASMPLPAPTTITLAYPLTTADLHDGATVRHLVRPKDLPSPTFVPVGYSGGVQRSDLESGDGLAPLSHGGQAVTRSYVGPISPAGTPSLLVSAYPSDLDDLAIPSGTADQTTVMAGLPARITNRSGSAKERCVYWQGPERNARSVCSRAPTTDSILDVPELLRIAGSIPAAPATVLDYPLAGVRWKPIATIAGGVVTPVNADKLVLRFRTGEASMAWACSVTNHPIGVDRTTIVSGGYSAGPSLPCSEAERAAGDTAQSLVGGMFTAGMPMQYRIRGDLLTLAEGNEGVVYRGELGDGATPAPSPNAEPLPTQGLINRTWVLQVAADGTDSIDLGLTSSRFMMSTYCNPTGGELQYDQRFLKFLHVTTTAMACLARLGEQDPGATGSPPSGGLSSERQLGYTLNGATLTITGQNGESMFDGSSALDVALPFDL